MIYLDTSAAVPLFVPEPASARIEVWFSGCDDVLVSADWILTEFASALSIKERGGAITRRAARSVWDAFGEFCETGLRLVPVSRRMIESAARLVRDSGSGLRAGDSLHLAAALDLRATSIATIDANLATNARRNGLPPVELS